MHERPVKAGGVLSGWWVAAGSAAILFHLTAIIIPILDVPSGPWPTGAGNAMGDPPQFAHGASGLTTLHGKYLRIAHSYDFVTNRPGDMGGVRFEVRLRDADRNVMGTYQFPDPTVNPWVRHRQTLLASALAPDQSIPPPAGELLAAPGQKAPTLSVWLLPEEDSPEVKYARALALDDRKVQLRLRTIPQHLVPRNRQVMRPSAWSLVLAQSYSRYLCRQHGAASAELIRVTRDPVLPAPLFGSEPPASAFEDLVATFGEVSP